MANDKDIEIKGKVDIDLSDTKEQVLDFTSQISNLDKEINKLQNTLAKQARQMEIWANKEVKNKKGEVTKPLGEIPQKAKNNFENTKTNLFGVIQKRNELYAQQVIYASKKGTPRTQSELQKYIEKEKRETEKAMNQSYSGGGSFSNKIGENKRQAKLGAIAKTSDYSNEIQKQVADLFDSVIEESKKQNEKTYQSYLKSYTQSRKKEEAELRELKPGGENGEYKPRQLSRIKLTPEQSQEVQQMARKDANNRSPVINANMGASYINKWFSSLNENIGVSGREKGLFDEIAKVFGKHAPKVQKALEQYVLVLDSQEKILLSNIEIGQKEAEENRAKPFRIKTEYNYTSDYEEYTPSSKSLVQPFYLLKDYNGRENETRFIKHLEDNIDVKNWFKNGSHGKDSFCIKYFKTDEQVFDGFYPDWIVLYKNGDIGIFDTKKGNTGVKESQTTRDKAKALHEKIDWLNHNSKLHYIGGILELDSAEWKNTSINLFNSKEN